jgi:hypothetical protein
MGLLRGTTYLVFRNAALAHRVGAAFNFWDWFRLSVARQRSLAHDDFHPASYK